MGSRTKLVIVTLVLGLGITACGGSPSTSSTTHRDSVGASSQSLAGSSTGSVVWSVDATNSPCGVAYTAWANETVLNTCTGSSASPQHEYASYDNVTGKQLARQAEPDLKPAGSDNGFTTPTGIVTSVGDVFVDVTRHENPAQGLSPAVDTLTLRGSNPRTLQSRWSTVLQNCSGCITDGATLVPCIGQEDYGVIQLDNNPGGITTEGIDFTSGKVVWTSSQFELTTDASASTSVVGDRLFLQQMDSGGGNQGYVLISTQTGTTVASYGPARVFGQDGKYVVVQQSSNQPAYDIFDTSTGTSAWQLNFPAALLPSPLNQVLGHVPVSGDPLVADYPLKSYDLATGATRWSLSVAATYCSANVKRNQIALVANGQLVMVNAQTGGQESYAPGGNCSSVPDGFTDPVFGTVRIHLKQKSEEGMTESLSAVRV
jgi:hypothetical protein